jgi:hypothetical protein
METGAALDLDSKVDGLNTTVVSRIRDSYLYSPHAIVARRARLTSQGRGTTARTSRRHLAFHEWQSSCSAIHIGDGWCFMSAVGGRLACPQPRLEIPTSRIDSELIDIGLSQLR